MTTRHTATWETSKNDQRNAPSSGAPRESPSEKSLLHRRVHPPNLATFGECSRVRAVPHVSVLKYRRQIPARCIGQTGTALREIHSLWHIWSSVTKDFAAACDGRAAFHNVALCRPREGQRADPAFGGLAFFFARPFAVLNRRWNSLVASARPSRG